MKVAVIDQFFQKCIHFRLGVHLLQVLSIIRFNRVKIKVFMDIGHATLIQLFNYSFRLDGDNSLESSFNHGRFLIVETFYILKC